MGVPVACHGRRTLGAEDRAIATVILKRGRSRPVVFRHPWVYSGGVDRIEGECADGDLVEVRDHRGQFLGRGHINHAARVRVRMAAWADGAEGGAAAGADTDLALGRIEERLASAVSLRDEVLRLGARTDAWRVVNGEGDGLDGLVVDRYGGVLVVQVGSLALERLKGPLLDVLARRLSPVAIYERGDPELRHEEGLGPASGWVRGADPGAMTVTEDGLRHAVDVARGQKTGLYLDQRDNRRRVRELAAGRRVLDACCYTGGFALAAAAGGAREVLAFDRSRNALAAAEANARANGLAVGFVAGELFEVLGDLARRGERFDLVNLDPPSFAPARRHLRHALAAYREAQGLACRLVAPGGILVSSSCSKHVGEDELVRALNEGAVDAGRSVSILERRAQAPDHPVAASCPEGRYLKCLVCRVA
ncbi:MAG: class I SAM-dependent rRNA methyltransferase [Planctomycetes bacterium]|nr:class I SAM-dependent rRNA methyltransferase [Planctomycetota bacterium]